MSKSAIWSTVVFTAFVGSAAYVGASAATAPQSPGMEADLFDAPAMAAQKPKAVRAVKRAVTNTVVAKVSEGV